MFDFVYNFENTGGSPFDTWAMHPMEKSSHCRFNLLISR